MSTQTDSIDKEDVLALSEKNIPTAVKTSGITLRSLVSKKKLRFVSGGYDIDLSYITDRLIAMGFPSAGLEAVYRNPVDAVKSFLESRHPGAYRIWNLCSERAYGPGSFACEIERFTWDDHTPPPFSLIRPTCESIQTWLNDSPSNVAAIHCKAGKGRTGTIIAAHLVHQCSFLSADDALRIFSARRTRDGKGVTIPSQARFVRYYGFQRAAIMAYAEDGQRIRGTVEGFLGPGHEVAPAPPLNTQAEEEGDVKESSASPSPSADGTGDAGGLGIVTDDSSTSLPTPLASPLLEVPPSFPTPAPASRGVEGETGTSSSSSLSSSSPSGTYPPTGRIIRIDGAGDATPSRHRRESIALPVDSSVLQDSDVLITLELKRSSDRVLGFRIRSGAKVEGTDEEREGGSRGSDSSDSPTTNTNNTNTAVSSTSAASGTSTRVKWGKAGSGKTKHHPITVAFVNPDPSTTTTSSTTPTTAAEGSTPRAVIYQHVAHVLKTGDEIVSVNGVSTSGKGLEEVVSLFRSGADPLLIVVKRRAHHKNQAAGRPPTPSTPSATTTTQPSEPLITPDVYLSRLLRGIGPWAEGCDGCFVPHPAVRLTGIKVLHPPKSQAGGAGWWICGGGGAGDALQDSSLRVQVYGGAHCRTLIYDSNESYSSSSTGGGGRGRERDGSVNISIAPPTTPNGLKVAGDFKIVVKLDRKVLAAAWLHTACLPLPDRVQSRLADEVGEGVRVVKMEDVESPPKGMSLPPISPSSPRPTSTLTLITSDVPGGDVPTPGTPTLGALYTAASSVGTGSLAGVPRLDDLPQSSSLPLATLGGGRLTLPKHLLDKALKDKKHRKLPQGFTLEMSYVACSLPVQLGEVFSASSGAGGGGAGAVAASSASLQGSEAAVVGQSA